jgi:MATE family multidrug resistance protein
MLADLAQNYLRILSFGLIPALVVLVLKNYLAALELTQVVLAITVAALLLNIPLNYLLIFGKYGAPELGVGGAAWASLAVHLLSALAIALYAWRRLPEHKLFLRFWRPDWSIFSKLFKIGMPIGLTHLAEAGLFYASSVMMGWLGVIALAAHGIALQISSVTFVVHLGLAAAATVRAGNAYGRKDFVGLRDGAVVATLASIGLSLLTLILFVTFPTALVGLFIDAHDPARDQILALGAVLLVVSGLFQFVDGGQVMALSLLRGIQDTSVPLLIAVIGYWAIGLPVGYVLGFWLGFDGVGIWAGIAVGLAIVALTLGHRFVKLLGQMLRRDVLRSNSDAGSD